MFAFIACLTERELRILRFQTFIKEELLIIQSMRTNYVPKHSRDDTDSEYVSYVEVDRKGAEIIGNKQINSLTNAHTDTQLFTFVHNCSHYCMSKNINVG